MFPFTSFRAECLRVLGFNGFFQDRLSDTAEVYAFLLPRRVFEKKEYTPIVDYLHAAFVYHGWSSVSEVLEKGVYETNHCQGRHHTHILGPHILLHLTYESQEALKPAKPASVHNWVVVEASYDAVKSPQNRRAYYTWLYEAASPADYEATQNRLVAQAKAATA